MKLIKKTFPCLVLAAALLPASAFAYSGANTLTCKSVSGSSQSVVFTLTRSNATGWTQPTYSLTLNGKKYDFTPPDMMKSYGQTIHDSPLGLIYVTANNSGDGELNQGVFSVKAIPSTVKTVDSDGKTVQWSLANEKDSCFDSNGKATFQGVFGGSLDTKSDANAPAVSVPVDTNVLDCELDYDSGMAC